MEKSEAEGVVDFVNCAFDQQANRWDNYRCKVDVHPKFMARLIVTYAKRVIVKIIPSCIIHILQQCLRLFFTNLVKNGPIKHPIEGNKMDDHGHHTHGKGNRVEKKGNLPSDMLVLGWCAIFIFW